VGQPIIFTSNYKNENPENLNLVVADKESSISYSCFVDIVDSNGRPLDLDEYSVPVHSSESESESTFDATSFTATTASTPTTTTPTDTDTQDGLKSITEMKRGKLASLRDKLMSSHRKQQTDHHKNNNDNNKNGNSDSTNPEVKTMHGDWRRSCTLATFGECLFLILVVVILSVISFLNLFYSV